MGSPYRSRPPQLGDDLFLADGGIETTLVFHEGIALTYFAAFDLLRTEAGAAALRAYFERYARLARRLRTGLVLETPTWRANRDWGTKLGYDAAALEEANRRGVELLLAVRAEQETASTPIVISGNIGPRGDGYRPGELMSIVAAQDYHAAQIDAFAAAGADLVSAFTMNYVAEAVGIVRAAREAGIPVVISFTTETDGRLPEGTTLAQAIAETDALSGGYPMYYMINCAHPEHLAGALEDRGPWRYRVRGLRANASRRSHAELDESPDLDTGDPAELAGQYAGLRADFPRLTVVGGCCGTDHRHVEAIGAALQGAVEAALAS